MLSTRPAGGALLDQEALFDAFSTWHTDRRNRLCHDVGLPLISFAVLGALAKVPLGPVDLGLVLLLGTLAFDLAFWRRQALGVFVMGVALWGVGRALPLSVHGAAFALGWVFQLVGHRVFERNAPAFVTNLVHLVVGPRWLVRRWTRALRGQAA